MTVLVACEFSGVVREAFRRRGHDAWSVDLLPAEDGSPFHHESCVGPYLNEVNHIDLMIAFPPCTHLAVSGARWFKDKTYEQVMAIDFVRMLMSAPIPMIAIENPIGILSTHIRKPDQIIHPWQFGHPEFKSTCLWLKGLPRLQPTNALTVPQRCSAAWKQWNRIHREPPGPDRWKNRSRTYQGIADAMAEQWGNLKEWSLTA